MATVAEATLSGWVGKDNCLNKLWECWEVGICRVGVKEKCPRTENEGKIPCRLRTLRVPWLHHAAALLSTALINTSLQQG